MIYVVWWQYSDKSGAGHIQAFRTKEAADKFRNMMELNGDTIKTYAVAEVPFTKE